MFEQGRFGVFDESFQGLWDPFVLVIVGDLDNVGTADLPGDLFNIFDKVRRAFAQQQLDWAISVDDSAHVVQLFVDLKLFNKKLVALGVEQYDTGFFQLLLLDL